MILTEKHILKCRKRARVPTETPRRIFLNYNTLLEFKKRFNLRPLPPAFSASPGFILHGSPHPRRLLRQVFLFSQVGEKLLLNFELLFFIVKRFAWMNNLPLFFCFVFDDNRFRCENFQTPSFVEIPDLGGGRETTAN